MLGFGAIGRKLFGTTNDRKIKAAQKTVDAVNELEAEFEGLSDEALRAKTDEFKTRLDQGEDLDELLPEAFAVVRALRAIDGSPTMAGPPRQSSTSAEAASLWLVGSFIWKISAVMGRPPPASIR